MSRTTIAFVCCALVASIVPPAFARTPAKHGVKAVVHSLNLTPAQKASVRDAIQAHRADLQAARASGHKAAMIQARRAALQDVLQVLTPDQRDQVMARVKKKLRG